MPQVNTVNKEASIALDSAVPLIVHHRVLQIASETILHDPVSRLPVTQRAAEARSGLYIRQYCTLLTLDVSQYGLILRTSTALTLDSTRYMGWWWSDQASKPRVGASLSTKLPEGGSSVSGLQQEPVTVSGPQAASQDITDEDVLDFFKKLENESKPRTDATLAQVPPIQTGDLDDISPEALYPTKLSCQSVLDYAMFCQAFGGQFVNIYRYGKLRSCSNHWKEFWLCMRTRNWEELDRAQAIRGHQHQKLEKYRTGPSSEDVWEIRTTPLKDAFQGDLEALEEQVRMWEKSNPGAENPFVRPRPSEATSP